MSTKKIPWAKRLEAIKQDWPSIENLNWEKAFQEDIELFGRIVRDILKQEQAEPGHSGPRPSLDKNTAKQKLRQILGMDYSIEEFSQSFKALAGDRSIRHLALKTGLNRNTIHRLLRSEIDPDLYTMQTIAKAFNRHPSYFLEYRLEILMLALESQMKLSPEITIDLYRRVTRGSHRSTN